MKFRRQSPIGWYVVDFLCMEKSLIIEIDGGIHEKQRGYDREREAILRERGYRILRFTNAEVLRRLPSVLHAIAQTCGRQEP